MRALFRGWRVAACLILGLVFAAPYASAAPLDRSFVDIELNATWSLQRLAQLGYNVVDRDGDVATLYLSNADLNRLRQSDCSILTVTPETPAPPKEFGVYSTYASLTAELEAYATAFPTITRLESLGQSVEGRELWALHISDNPGLEEDEPEFKYVSTMHGDEPVGTELCLYFIDRLLNGYGVEERITTLIDSTAISIVPLMNPDGLENGVRRNSDGLDLNRSFPAFPGDFENMIFDGEPLGAGDRTPEVARIMEWSADNSFTLSANLHTGALLVNYPYDHIPGVFSGQDAPTPDDALFEELSSIYAEQNPPMAASTQFPGGISNGSAWFVAIGGMQDWNYRYLGNCEVTIELADIKKPNASELPGLWEDNEEAMLRYLEAAHRGVRGIVTDAETDAPVYAEVLINGNPQPVFTDPDVGDYHRLLLPGAYTVTINAPGYDSQTIADVVVGAEGAARVDVALQPSGTTGGPMCFAASASAPGVAPFSAILPLLATCVALTFYRPVARHSRTR